MEPELVFSKAMHPNPMVITHNECINLDFSFNFHTSMHLFLKYSTFNHHILLTFCNVFYQGHGVRNGVAPSGFGGKIKNFVLCQIIAWRFIFGVHHFIPILNQYYPNIFSNSYAFVCRIWWAKQWLKTSVKQRSRSSVTQCWC